MIDSIVKMFSVESKIFICFFRNLRIDHIMTLHVLTKNISQRENSNLDITKRRNIINENVEGDR